MIGPTQSLQSVAQIVAPFLAGLLLGQRHVCCGSGSDIAIASLPRLMMAPLGSQKAVSAAGRRDGRALRKDRPASHRPIVAGTLAGG